jgi:hypothetical protein
MEVTFDDNGRISIITESPEFNVSPEDLVGDFDTILKDTLNKALLDKLPQGIHLVNPA